MQLSKAYKYHKRYRRNNKEKIAKQKALYHLRNREKILSNRKMWGSKNKAKIKAYGKIYFKKNKHVIKLKQKIYYDKNKTQIALRNKVYRNAKKPIRNAHERWRRKNDLFFKLIERARGRLGAVLRNRRWEKITSFREYIGCDLQTFKKHIENQFQLGMTWDNRGVRGWHIDHIIPLSIAKTERQLYKLCHYSNLRPLWAVDNLQKGNKVVS